MVLTWHSREGEPERCCSMNTEFQFCEMKTALKSDCTTTMNILNPTETPTLKNDYDGKDFKFCAFHPNF